MLDLKTALKARLVAAGVNGGQHLYDSLAPAGTPYPYILFQYISGGEDNLTALDTRDERWQIKAVSDNHTVAHALAAAIRAALHQQALSVTGWRHLETVQTENVWLVESSARLRIYHAGGMFRIRLHRMG